MSSRSGRKTPRSSRADEFKSLSREMEIAEYAKVGVSAQSRKMVPRKIMRERTQKRKLLEKEDRTNYSLEVDDDGDRLRGSKKMMEEEFVHDSYVMRGDEEDDGEDEEDVDIDDEEDDQEVDDQEGDDDDGMEDFDDDEGDVEVEKEDHDTEIVEALPKKRKSNRQSATKKKKSDRHGSVFRTKKRRKLYRMKNFKSIRMADRHGDALSAHARGDHLLAIKKLQEVAADAPAAPQVYASLGMVYEEMMNQIEGAADSTEEWKERLDWAKKAYAAYHISAVLCKKDYMAWVRAADTARVVSDLYTLGMKEAQDADKYRLEKLHWIQETLKDYRAADNLKPPGIDVPAKLAVAHMQMGNLSEALAILTDLKNRRQNHTYQTWMLYADLMLRIGHECTQWNKGDEFQQNYMFRRWLRKFSQLFDWQERRLQALVLALECAAGSVCTQKVVEWAFQRARAKSKQVKLDSVEASPQTKTDDGSGRWNMDSYETQQDVEDENDKEIEENAQDVEEEADAEVQASELMLVNPGAKEVWNGIRNATEEITTQEENEQSEEVMHMSDSDEEENDADTERKATIAISASGATVTGIASVLIKHCLGLSAFDGGRLVAESVALYLQERVARREERIRANIAFEEKQKSTAKSILLQEEAYDEVEDDDAVSLDGMMAEYLSDEELLDDKPELLEHMRKGILPSELRVLYALSLIGEGSWDYLASQCITSIQDLEDDVKDAIDLPVIDTDAISYPAWQVYKRAMTDPLTKLPALAFVADLLQKADKEKEWSDKLSHIFWKEIESMKAVQLIDKALSSEKSKNPRTVLRRTQVLKIVVAGSRFRVLHAEAEALSDLENAHTIVLQCYDDIHAAMRPLWRVPEIGSPAKISIEAMELMMKAAQLVERTCTSDHSTVIARLGILAEAFTEGMKGPSEANGVLDEETNLNQLPLSSSWQTPQLRFLSVRAHNLCIANSVTLFSGWSTEEFNLNLLQRNGRNKYFGITLNDGRIVGHIDPAIAQDLREAWGFASTLLGIEFDFNDSLIQATGFLEHGNLLKRQEDDDVVALHCERSGLRILVSYMNHCFMAAQKLDDPSAKREDFIRKGLSVLLPITQFGVVKHIWDSTIGQATVSLAGLADWRNMAGGGRSKRKTGVTTKYQKRSIGQWHQVDRDLIARFVPIKVQHILLEWNGNVKKDESRSNSAEKADKGEHEVCAEKNTLQRKLHEAIRKLRVCSTEPAIQKASLQVTLALIKIMPISDNPFLIMHHAAMFASQCAKAGDLNLHFMTALPLKEACEPKQALGILMRADCMQAVHFVMEATYLCSFVTSCVEWHRENTWTNQWKIIGVYAYNISLAIRSTICVTAGAKEFQSKALEAWDDIVLSELERCRLDALDMRRAYEGIEGKHDEEEEDGDELEEDEGELEDDRDDMVQDDDEGEDDKDKNEKQDEIQDEIQDAIEDGGFLLDNEAERQEATKDALAEAVDRLVSSSTFAQTSYEHAELAMKPEEVEEVVAV